MENKAKTHSLTSFVILLTESLKEDYYLHLVPTCYDSIQ